MFDVGPKVKPNQFHRSCVALETYVQTNYKEPKEIVVALWTVAKPADLIPPTSLTRDDPDGYALDIQIFLDHSKTYKAWLKTYCDNEAWARGLIYSQCTTNHCTQLEGSSKFQTCKDAFDAITLLTLIEGLCSNLGDKVHGCYAVAESFKSLCIYYQPNSMPNDDYYQQLKGIIHILNNYANNGVLGHLPLLATEELTAMAAKGGYLVASVPDNQCNKGAKLASNKFLLPSCSVVQTSSTTMPSVKNYLTAMPWVSTTIPLHRKTCYLLNTYKPISPAP